MAEVRSALGYVCRSCRLGLKRGPSSIRGFSSTPAPNKTLVEFTPSSSPELDTVLNQYRETLFIPSTLSKNHLRLIYRPSRHSVLLNEPGVTVTLVNDEDLKLRPMKMEDRPVKAKALPQILKALSSSEDDSVWNNVFPFLVGMRVAKQTIPEGFRAQIIRRAYEKGKFSIPLRCALQADKTGIMLCHREVTKEMVIGCHRRAAAAAFEGDDLLSAAKQAEQIALLLEKEDHCGGKLREGEVDMRQSLMVVGLLLEMAAAKAINSNGGKDTDGQVAAYVAKALTLSETGFTEPVAVSPMPPKAKTGHVLSSHLPLWHGMKLASKVQGAISSDVQPTFTKRFQSLDKMIEDAASQSRSAEHTPKRALEMYDQLKTL